MKNPMRTPYASLALAAAGLAAGLADTAWAQTDPTLAEPLLEGAINVQKFNPAPGPRNFLTARGARTDGEHAFSVGLLASFAKDPFVIATAGDDTNVVQGVFTGDVLASYTPIPILQLGLRLPITYVKGNGVNPIDGSPGTFTEPPRDIAATGLSDPELEGKFRIVGEPDAPFVLGAALFLGAPLGEATTEGSYIGAESVNAGGRVIADLHAGPALFAANVGYRYKKEGRILETEFGSDLIYAVGAGVGIGPSVQILAEVFGSTQFSDDPSTNASELLGAVRFLPLSSSWAISAGGGVGLAAGSVGVPTFRGLVGVLYSHEASDQDGDAILDDDDQCPTEAEDTDGFEDADGCPDLDNDGDAIPDTSDKCVSEAEDLDGFQDQDGCPDRDNDKDGIKDESDRCPAEPEAVNGFEDEDGCPDTPDKDSDGIPDDKDKCPGESEDTDGFEDLDGCPDPDNDGDGIPDDRDECVDEAEDLDKKEDEDGCPE